MTQDKYSKTLRILMSFVFYGGMLIAAISIALFGSCNFVVAVFAAQGLFIQFHPVALLGCFVCPIIMFLCFMASYNILFQTLIPFAKKQREKLQVILGCKNIGQAFSGVRFYNSLIIQPHI